MRLTVQLFLAAALAVFRADAAEARPNLVLILADDLGCFGPVARAQDLFVTARTDTPDWPIREPQKAP